MSGTPERRGRGSDAPRVVVVDDSPFMRRLISDVLSDAGISIVGTAGDGAEAIDVVAEQSPDVVTMDVEMPGMNGLEAVERIMDETPTPVLMLSAHTDAGAEVTFDALERGAVDFFAKPGGEVTTGVSREGERLAQAVHSVADADLDVAMRESPTPDAGGTGTARRGASTGNAAGSANGSAGESPSDSPTETGESTAGVGEATDASADGEADADLDDPLTVIIGASTGGPNAVERVMAALPAVDCRVVIVQHMPEAFTERFADRLDEVSAYDVREAADGARIGAGEAVVARGGSHTLVDSYRAGRLRIKLDEDDSRQVMPAVDVTMESAAEAVDDPLVGVVLTGMGSDGADGIRAVAEAGGRTLVQSEESCVIYGMPKRAVATGAVDEVHDLSGVADAIVGGVA
ncbi:chemotaxis-specific protein-glutamate methyltransferase CheB [Haloparvum sp. PAK95]|uniref:chemotaxis-specific protein-glutamate methyltransferase CheB n=1 Tax=Haloparvum sp. PAK95 TaxID=3418962 RepID=UPI003D2F4E64